MLMILRSDAQDVAYLLETESGFFHYQWYKSSNSSFIEINGANGSTHFVDEPGFYYATFSCLDSITVNPNDSCKKRSEFIMILPLSRDCGDTAVVLNAGSVVDGSYKWFHNDSEIVGEVDSLLMVNTVGSYYSEIIPSKCPDTIISAIFNIQFINFNCDTLNAPPVATNDNFVGSENNTITGSVAPNDSDPNNDLLTFTLLNGPENGTLNDFGSNGSFMYTPNNGFSGLDQFTYIICDPNNLCDTATVFIEVTDFPEISFPTGISPNGDGMNDVLVFDGLISSFPNAMLKIYNRWGDEVWSSFGPYKNNWGGENFNGSILPDGVYYYLIDFKDDATPPYYNIVNIYRL